jgi:hypothetical protein
MGIPITTTTDEHWQLIAPGCSMLWSNGDLLCQHHR